MRLLRSKSGSLEIQEGTSFRSFRICDMFCHHQKIRTPRLQILRTTPTASDLFHYYTPHPFPLLQFTIYLPLSPPKKIRASPLTLRRSSHARHHYRREPGWSFRVARFFDSALSLSEKRIIPRITLNLRQERPIRLPVPREIHLSP